MSSNSRRNTSSSDPFGEAIFKIMVLLLCALVLPLLLLGLLGSRFIQEHFPNRQRLIWWSIFPLALLGGAIGYRLFWPLQRDTSLIVLIADFVRSARAGLAFNYLRLLHELVPVWTQELLLVPASLLIFALYTQMRPVSPAQLAQKRAQQKNHLTQRARKAAERKLQKKKEIADGLTLRNGNLSIVLGAPVEGTLLDWIKNRLFYLPFEYVIRHIVVLGASGSGKSETLLRIAFGVAKVLKWQIIYIDAKGDYKAAARFLLLMQEAGIANVKMFPISSYDGWRGSRDALLSKLLAIDNVAEVTSSGQHHYATVRENLVEMCVNAPGGPPTSSKELLERLMLTNSMLYDLYEGYAEQQSYLKTLLQRPQDALSAYGHYRAFFSKVRDKLDGKWSFDDCDAAYILLDGLALPEITDGLGRFVMADFVNYATRKDWGKRVMLIFDEVGSLNVPLYNIFEKVRFRNVSVVVSSQDPSGLARKPGGIGTWDEVRRVLGNSAIKILHRCEDAHEVIKRAGTMAVPEESYRTDEYGATSGAGTTRFHEELKINHNDVLRLKAGETFVIGPGEYQRVNVAMRNVDETRFRELYKDLERRSKEEPPPLQRRRQGGQPVVDSTLASPSPTQKSGSSKNTSAPQNGLPSGQKPGGKPQGKQGLSSPSVSPSSQSRAQPVKPATPDQSTPPATIPQREPDVDETLPFSLPEANLNVPIQPGVLPMWDEGEDLLP